MDKTSQEGLTGKSSPGLTLRVALGAMAAFLTNSLPSGFNMGVVNTPEQVCTPNKQNLVISSNNLV